MSLEPRRSERPRGELEISQHPDVARFATELTTLFKVLGLSQEHYAVRIHVDSSLVSRYLRGRRVAPGDFVDRLVREVELHRTSTVKEEVKNQLHDLRMKALHSVDPSQYELESLQEEVKRSRRDIHRLELQCEGLVLLLDQKQAESAQAKGDLLKLQADWIAERVKSEATALLGQRERLQLKTEIELLQSQLTGAMQLKEQAEQRCRDLADEMLALEGRIAIEREAERSATIAPQSFGEFHRQLDQLWDSGNVDVAYQTLANTARMSPYELIAPAVHQLAEQQRHGAAKRLMSDAVCVRPADQIIAIYQELKRLPDAREPLIYSRNILFDSYSEIGYSRNLQDSIAIYEGLTHPTVRAGKGVGRAIEDRIIASWIMNHAPGEASQMLEECMARGYQTVLDELPGWLHETSPFTAVSLIEAIWPTAMRSTAESLLSKRFQDQHTGQIRTDLRSLLATLKDSIDFKCWEFLADWIIDRLGDSLFSFIHVINTEGWSTPQTARLIERLASQLGERLNEQMKPLNIARASSPRFGSVPLAPITEADTVRSALGKISTASA